MEYGELLEKYNLVVKENEALKAENEHFRKLLNIESPVVFGSVRPSCNGINKYSQSGEKIALFRSLFCGREDVFARRWYSKTTEKSGYQPVCENEWVDTLCDKKKYKCSVCPNRKLMNLTDEDIFRHLSGKDEFGRDVIGIYPMLKDENCNFLCVDFDNRDYKEAAGAFRSICNEYDIPVSTERSRSGNGAHVWIFFEKPVSAAVARKLGSGILTKAMECYSGVEFKSYDRIFPNQDTMPNGGFGNLIALPLQGRARKVGNSMFVDDEFLPYEDQWAYLAGITKLSVEKAESIVKILCKNGDLGNLVSDSEEKPWEIKKEKRLSFLDFPDKTAIVKANMLYIPTSGLSAYAKNVIIRLAAFRNPDFYRAQAMRLPIYDKPRIICTADVSSEYIGLPRGCEAALCELLESNSCAYSIDDKTNPGRKIPVSFNGTLREEQQSAANELLKYDNGVLSATTAFGKTVVASYLIGTRKTNTLVLVHTQSLLQQWKKSLERFLDIETEPPLTKKGKIKKSWSPIGILGAGKKTLRGNVDIALMQSLINGDEIKELVRNYGMVIVDECHHVSAVNFEKILKFANEKYVYGLTATPTRQDGHHPIVFMQCGPVRYKVDAKRQAEKSPFGHCLIPRFTSYRSAKPDLKITELYRSLSENVVRNTQIVNDVKAEIAEGRCPIILTERREHVLLLAESLSGYCKNTITLFGTCSQKERRETFEHLEKISRDEKLLIIATGKYVGEGFDYPRLDTLFLALPIAWKGKVAQYAGRLHREYPGKNEVRIYDYVDIHIPVLEKMYQKRLKGYGGIGYKVKCDISSPAEPDLIYDGKSFYQTFCNDIKSSSKEVIIVSPIMRKGRITQLMKPITEAILNGVSITVVTRPCADYKEQEREKIAENITILRNYGIEVVEKSGVHQRFTVVDQVVVWYGSVNFLSFGAAEESIMRFTNADIAGQIMDTVLC